MKIFISWSGNSEEVASALFDVLPRLFDDAEPFMSTEMRAGAIWLPELERQLAETDFGIICLTKSNSRSRWLHYEAGALSRGVGVKREVMPVMLIDVDSPEDVGGPFAGFQLKSATREGFLDIVNAINETRQGPKVGKNILAERVENYWSRIETAIDSVKPCQTDSNGKRDLDSIVGEVLQIVRGLALSPGRQSGWAIDESALSEGISRRILRKLSTRDDEDGSWTRFDHAVRALAERLSSSYQPDFMVGVYPEGGFVGYLLWLDSERRWPFILAPDADKPPLPEELTALGAKISAICEGKSDPRGLVVDAAMKTGRTMQRTVEIVRSACAEYSLEPEIRTLCLSVREGYSIDEEHRAAFVGMDGGLTLPFG